ncbi:MAG: UDP-glucose--hexose-1-phosphate uridylyltransferase [Synergistaceae bacterium]|nr:UDP-glucose--hexose-1-phosphate uridylyltransferase [Synergistaceae bacterium]MBR0094009.1 UDP-glucose--hexose-1-phosphate uridylyltransferase [Synergistaceae bacterium]
MVNHELNNLISFALHHGLIEPDDTIWAANSLIGILGLNSFEFEAAPDTSTPIPHSPDSILAKILDWAAANNLIEDTETERDLLDTKLMGVFTPRPSDVIEKFAELEKISPKEATDYFYKLGVSSNYIRSERTAKNICWKSPTEFGELDITINMSKPEKDPRDIAKARAIKSSGYPKCLLCKENEGFYGHHGHPARQNIRLIPLKLCGRDWYFQYSPYSYYNEHCIVLDGEHVPMLISRETFENLFAFIARFPHYFAGSNADLPIVGGSILSHDHYQGGRYVFAMDGAPFERRYDTKDSDITAGRIKWPMSAIRLSSNDPEKLTNLAEKILSAWREWTDESVGILAYSDGEPHNTITPIARRKGEAFELDLVLRNNRTSDEHPLGIFHPHAEVHHIKKENIGLIEVMGLAVLPARLKSSLEKIQAAWLDGKETLPSELEIHEVWYRSLRERHANLTGADEVKAMLRDEVGHVFAQVLRDSGVYKRDSKGLAAFDKFAEAVIC